MKRILEISASFSGKIPTGAYENENPFFAVKEILEIESENEDFDDDYVKYRQSELQTICYEQFKAQAERAYQERLIKTYKNIRFYDGKDGAKYPSVTSIINMDEVFNMPPDELAQYGARGTVLHKQIEIFLQTGVWKLPKEIPEIAGEVMTVIKGNLGLDLEDTSFQNFYKDYPFKVLQLEKVVSNDKYKYAGRMDIKCVIESKNKGKWDKVEGVQFDVPTILDIKSGTIDKIKHLQQQSAYAMCDEDVKQIGLIPLNKENVCGYSKPILSDKVESYFNIFLKQRRDFQERYSI